MEETQKTIRKLVGNVTEEELRNVDSFVCPELAVFIPAVGPCYYSLSRDHTHPGYSFILTHDDRCRISVEGVERTTSSGRLCALSPGVPHHELAEEGFSRYAALMVAPEFFESQWVLYASGPLPRFAGEEHDAPGDIFPLLRRFMVESDGGLPGAGNVLSALALLIVHCLIRTVIALPATEERAADRLEINRVVEFLHRRYADELRVEDLASLAGLSESHFTRLFKSETGKTPAEYLIDVRLSRARRLLLAGSATITEIALDCGFGSSSHFTAAFRRTFGITPSLYRKNAAGRKSVKI